MDHVPPSFESHLLTLDLRGAPRKASRLKMTAFSKDAPRLDLKGTKLKVWLVHEVVIILTIFATMSSLINFNYFSTPLVRSLTQDKWDYCMHLASHLTVGQTALVERSWRQNGTFVHFLIRTEDGWSQGYEQEDPGNVRMFDFSCLAQDR